MRLRKLIFGEWSKWQDAACADSMGYHMLIQVKYNLKTNKKRLRVVKIWVNDSLQADAINKGILSVGSTKTNQPQEA